MKKIVIYLLTMLMAFSPVAVFADVEAAADQGDAVEVTAETSDAVEVAAEPADAVEEEAAVEVQAEEAAVEAPAEEADLVQAEPEDLQDEASAADPQVTVEPDPDVACTWVDTERTQAVDINSNPRAGLFKAPKVGGGTGLYYAVGDDPRVVTEVKTVTVGDGWRYTYHPYQQGQGEFWKYVSGGSYTYLINNHSGDFYIETEAGVYRTDEGKYYVKSDGTVKTDAGVVTAADGTYYVQTGGSIWLTPGWVNTADGRRFYLNNTEGRLTTNEGLYSVDGKMWYFAPGGAVRTTGGIFPYRGSLYYSYNDGSVNTAEGFVTTADGKTYFCANGGIIKSGIIDFGGKKYVAYNDGTICKTPGFINLGTLYYVSDASGALAVNKEFKVGSKKYHALANGTVAVGVHPWGNYYYYADPNGAIRTKKGILNWAGYRYYVKKGGKITTNKKFKYKGKTYIAGITGILNKGVFSWKGSLYYANSKSVLRTKAGAFTYNGNRYYSKKGGKLYVNKLFTAKGKKYLAQSDGTLKAGHFTWGGKMYLTDSKCAVITKAGMYTYGGHQYYVKKGGPLAVNEFVTYKDNHYYAGADGAIVKKKFTYKGVTLNPNATTGVIPLEEYWQVFPNEAPQQDTTNSGN